MISLLMIHEGPTYYSSKYHESQDNLFGVVDSFIIRFGFKKLFVYFKKPTIQKSFLNTGITQTQTIKAYIHRYR